MAIVIRAGQADEAGKELLWVSHVVGRDPSTQVTWLTSQVP